MIKHSCCNFQKENGFREIVENLKADAVKMANEYGNNRILGICLAVPGLFINRPEKNEEIFMVSEFEELSQIMTPNFPLTQSGDVQRKSKVRSGEVW